MTWKSVTPEERTLFGQIVLWIRTVRETGAKYGNPFYGPDWLPSDSDFDKSALLERIRCGLQPMDEPPPVGFACPWYALVEDAGPHYIFEVWFRDDYAIINQNAFTIYEQLGELAEACEKATGPDRELDVHIAVATDWHWPDWEEGESTARGQAEKHGFDWLYKRVTEGMASMWRHMPRYTASLDAAMTLVPEGWRWIMREACPDKSNPKERGFFARLETRDFESVTWGKGSDWITDTVAGQDVSCWASAPALALCAASLRARAHSTKGVDQ